ncbi:hypothetical protein JKP88DRAFT_287671 [Tribonema minus]|uniref:Uncharacterized protein n=1 Tax=Tribonema minus TaxID=303371 RepID=A0A836CIV4_9STRA|nr:hypothetical protein JKP88DRAFT_287671 [Tribonema minus]
MSTKKVLYRRKRRLLVKRRKVLVVKKKSINRSQITKVNVRVGGGTAPVGAAPVVVSGGGGSGGGASSSGGGGDIMPLLPFLIPPQRPSDVPPVTTAPEWPNASGGHDAAAMFPTGTRPTVTPPPAVTSLRDMQAEDADSFALPDYPVRSAERGVQATPSTDVSASQTLDPSTAAVGSQTRPASMNAIGTQVQQSLTARGSQTSNRRMTHTGAQTRPMTLNDGSTAPMLALEAPMQVDDALPHVPPGVASALRDAIAPIQRMIADLQRGFGDASSVTRMIAQQQIQFGNSIIGENREAKREVRTLFDTLRGELPRHVPPSGMPAGPVNAGPGDLVVYQDKGDDVPGDSSVDFDAAAAVVPPPPPAQHPAEAAAAVAAAMEAMRAAAPPAPAAAPLPDFNAAASMGPAPDAAPFEAPPKPKSKRVLNKLFDHLYHQGRTHGDATLIAAANTATDALKGKSPDLMALTMESLKLIKQAKQLEVARQAFGLQERETAAAGKDKRKPPKTHIVEGTKTRAKARAESERTKRAAKRGENRAAEIETRIARGEKPTMEAPPDKRARLALSVAQDAKRDTKPVLARDLWKTTKRYVDQNVGNVAGNLTVGGTAAVTGAATLSSTLAVTGVTTLTGAAVFGTTVGPPGTAAGARLCLYPYGASASTNDYTIGINGNTMFFNAYPAAKFSFCSGGTEVMAISNTGAITGGDLGGLLGRQLMLTSQTYVNVSASTRFDVPSTTVTALGSSMLVEADVNYTTTSTCNAGLTFQWQSKRSAVYVGSTMITYAVCTYGPTYATISFMIAMRR